MAISPAQVIQQDSTDAQGQENLHPQYLLSDLF